MACGHVGRVLLLVSVSAALVPSWANRVEAGADLHVEDPGPREGAANLERSGIVPLTGRLQPYEWGPVNGISEVLDLPKTGRSEAELWLGTHPSAPSTIVVGDRKVGLDQVIAVDPKAILGPEVASLFGNKLPFLMKVLFAAQPLSIQAHPDAEQAKAGYAREQEAIPSIATDKRNYRDASHKPEVILNVGSEPFYALSSFRPYEEIATFLNSISELRSLAFSFKHMPEGVKSLYETIMRWDEAERREKLGRWIAQLGKSNTTRRFTEATKEHWILTSDGLYSKENAPDRGLLSFGLLNFVALAPGKAMYLAAGELHAYLKGLGIEVMANSDNVLRGGLTPKHVDVDELVRVGRFEPKNPDIIESKRARSQHEETLPTPFREFQLSRIKLKARDSHPERETHGPHIGLVWNGTVEIVATRRKGDAPLKLEKGQAFFARHGVPYTIEGRSNEALIYRTSVSPQRRP